MTPPAIPVLERFADAANAEAYAPIPDDWVVFLSDVVDSTAAIEAGLYKAVNLAGAATISGVANALDGDLNLFVFGGDGAGFVVPPQHAQAARLALGRVSAWSQRDLGLELRVGSVKVSAIRAAGHDLLVAFWQASEAVRYAMFDGGGMAWASAQLKSGTIRFEADPNGAEPDLTGLSCQWGSVPARQGKIVSLIVKPAAGASAEQFTRIVETVVGILETGVSVNPVPPNGPVAKLRPDSLGLQFHVPSRLGRLWRKPLVVASTFFAWLVFVTGVRLGSFDPARYRREISSNTDYRKFDDGLLITADCSPLKIERLQAILTPHARNGRIRFGLHMQDEALMTCIAPSVSAADHMHFVDGAGGGYAAAARQMAGSG